MEKGQKNTTNSQMEKVKEEDVSDDDSQCSTIVLQDEKVTDDSSSEGGRDARLESSKITLTVEREYAIF